MIQTGEQNGRHTAPDRAKARSVLLVGEAGQLETELLGLLSEPLQGGLAADAAGLRPTSGRRTWSAGRVETCADWFEAVSRLARRSYDVVVLPAGSAERRPEAALRTLREAAGDARIVLVSAPTHEGLSRRMLAWGADEYHVFPVSAEQLIKSLGMERAPAVEPAVTDRSEQPEAIPVGRGSTASVDVARAPNRPLTPSASEPAGRPTPPPAALPENTPFTLAGLAVAEILLDAMVREPADAASAAIRELNARLPAGARLDLQRVTDRDPTVPPGMTLLSQVIRLSSSGGSLEANPDRDAWVLHLFLSLALDETAASGMLAQVAAQITRVLELQDRHCRLQKLAITDDLTGLYNTRYFRHFLERILQRAREGRFPVTLLMFDIDSFKKYNDSFGHAVGDEILKQTARMIKRCVRDHDLVARLGGDEFAVVFWEKDGPRHVISSGPAAGKVSSGRPPQSPVSVFERFKRMIAGHDFEALGPNGRGQLTISGGLAVYPYDARTPDELIEAADKALMFGAKKSGKNTIHLVGQEEQ